ncbi:MAG: threonine synthase [Candidatus Bathyarchaeota archaeon]|jgi:threonine synthase|nr:threonine synthase [Candidatus Bathyarchaeota archaeon]MDP7442867.1 threonine synthase [Candidatus Bathyarchaeota archaeon]
MSYFTHLECSKCGHWHDINKVQTVCVECGKPLFARYDLEALKSDVSPADLVGREASMWRYWELLPVKNKANKVSLGEGWTPLTQVKHLGKAIRLPDLWIKDEGIIPTGTFKARGLAMAVSKAKELGIEKIALPSAGNAAGAMAAYGARARMESYVFMPVDAPDVNKIECQIVGAKVFLVNGLITDAGKMVADGIPDMGWFPLSTLKEPYRVEGKKTMGIEVVEQFEWSLPDVIIYPTGGGTGIIGMWKVFDELEELGWIGSERPKMVSVQASGCAPIPKAFEEEKGESEFWQNAETLATGLRVPHALGDFLVLNAARESGGSALAVTDDEIIDGIGQIAKEEGLFVCPEGAATFAALKYLIDDGKVDKDEKVVLFNTGSGIKYTTLFEIDAPVFDIGEKIDYKNL